MRPARKDPPDEQAHDRPEDAVKAAAKGLEDALGARKARLGDALKALRKAQDVQAKQVAAEQKAVERAREPERLGGMFSCPAVFDDRVVLNGKTYPLSPGVTAVADTAGNLSRTRRHTLTRFALLGPFSLFTPKAKKHDDRELFLLVEGPDWGEVVKLDPKLQSKAREIAQTITLAARNVDRAHAHRSAAVRDADARLRAAIADRREIDDGRAAVHRAATEHTIAQCVAWLDQALGRADEESRQVRKARRLVADAHEALAAPIPWPEEAPAPALGPPPPPPPLSLPPPPPQSATAAWPPPAPHALPPPAPGSGAGAWPPPAPPPPRSSSPPASGSGDLVEQLTRLGELRDAGVLTDAEFQEAKQAVLSRQ